MPRSTYQRDIELNWLKGTNAPNAPAAVYAGLWNGDPGLTGAGGTEVTDQIAPAGLRIAVTWGAIVSNAISNTAQVNFGESAGAVANVDYFALFDNPTPGLGNLHGSAALNAAKVVSIGDPVYFDIGDLSWTST